MSRSNWLILALAVLASVIGGFVQHRAQQPAASGSELIGQPAADLALPDLAGRLHHLADYRGRRVLLNFWASWCAPCLQELPALNRVQAKFGEHGPIVVGIAMDDGARVRPFLAAHPLDYQVLLGDLHAPSTSLVLGNTRDVLPYSVLLDTDGSILASHAGPLPPDQLERWLSGSIR